jgi:hypothetical protein
MNKSYAEVRPPYHTPWGHAQTHDRNGAGLWFVSTAGHGGLYMSPERLAHFKSIFPTFEGYAGLPWLEEDCDYCLGVLAFADDYEAEAVFYAWDMVMTYQSDNTFYFAEGRAWLLSDAGAAVRLKAETYSASRAGLWRRGGCGTQGIGWHTYWYRGPERATTETKDYVTQNWMTDAEIAASPVLPPTPQPPIKLTGRSGTNRVSVDANFNEADCGGVYDGHGVTSDADSGL